MFYKKSDYALNKRKKDTIVYIGVTGIVYLTREDFANEDEFLKWKSWSDGDYLTNEQVGRSFYDNTIPLDERLDVIGAVASIEDELFDLLDKAEHIRLCVALMEQVRSCLTAKQYRRLWLHYVDGLTIERIALAEGVTHQNVSKTIIKAKKKIEIFLLKQGAKTSIFM